MADAGGGGPNLSFWDLKTYCRVLMWQRRRVSGEMAPRWLLLRLICVPSGRLVWAPALYTADKGAPYTASVGAPVLSLGCSWAAPGLLLGCSWVAPGLLLDCSWAAPGLLLVYRRLALCMGGY